MSPYKYKILFTIDWREVRRVESGGCGATHMTVRGWEERGGRSDCPQFSWDRFVKTVSQACHCQCFLHIFIQISARLNRALYPANLGPINSNCKSKWIFIEFPLSENSRSTSFHASYSWTLISLLLIPLYNERYKTRYKSVWPTVFQC